MSNDKRAEIEAALAEAYPNDDIFGERDMVQFALSILAPLQERLDKLGLSVQERGELKLELKHAHERIAELEKKREEDNAPVTLDDSELIRELEYIAGSPLPKFGGFHPRVVATAKLALKRIAELEARLARYKDLTET